ncbi:hypothetical protein PQU63_08785 [Xanthomonas protegens]|uniref:LPS-assembly lipoprotein LptE n=1 Tax=Xanthomonas protegens TaxID=3380705 RepID=A0ABU9LC41_9XANT
MTRLLLAFVFAASLTACGFHLRNKLTLPADTPSVKVVSSAPYSELAKLLERGLRAAGAEIAPKDVNTGVARLEVLSERWGDLPIALDAEGRAQEYSLRYAAIFLFRRADGSVLVPQQVIELSRDYVSPPTDATGTSTEREILADELRREMSASMLRRIDSVVRAQVRDGKDVNAAPPSTDGTPVEGKPADGTPAAGKPATTPQP